MHNVNPKQTDIIQYAIIAALIIVGAIVIYFSVKSNRWTADGSTKEHGTYFMERMLYDGSTTTDSVTQ